MKINRFLMIMVCTIVLLLYWAAPVQAAGKPVVSVDAISAQAGETVTVPIRISNNTGICGATLKVNYDHELTLTGVNVGEAWSTLTMTKPGNFSSNPIRIVWDGMDADYSNGIIANLIFTAPQKNGNYKVSVSYDAGDVMDGNLDAVSLTVIAGSIEVESKAQASVDTAALSLDGRIGFHFSMSLPDNAACVVADGRAGKQRINVSALTKQADGTFLVSYYVPLAGAAAVVEISVLDAGGSRIEMSNLSAVNNVFGFTIDDYLAGLDTSTQASSIALVKCIKESANCAANYLNGANNSTVSGDMSDNVFWAYGQNGSGVLTGTAYRGTSLELVDTTAIRHYFDADPELVYIDGKRADVKSLEGLYYVEVAGITPDRFGMEHSLRIGSWTLNYSVFSYCKAACDLSGIEKLSTLCKSLYNYNVAALEYLSEN